MMPYDFGNAASIVSTANNRQSASSSASAIEGNLSARVLAHKQELLLALGKLKSLPNDWNGKGGIAPTSSSIRRAEQFVELTPDEKAQADYVQPDGDASVSLIWKAANRFTIMTFDGVAIHISSETPAGVEFPDPVPFFSFFAVMPASVLKYLPNA